MVTQFPWWDAWLNQTLSRGVQSCWLEMNSNLWCHFPGWTPLDIGRQSGWSRIKYDYLIESLDTFIQNILHRVVMSSVLTQFTLSLDVRYFIWKILLIHHNNQDLILDNLIKPISKFHINQLSELSQTINIHYTVYYQWTMKKISEE